MRTVAADFHKAFTPSFRADVMVSSEKSQAELELYARKSVEDYLMHI